jgi:drug/metabolite transporter (DMT)-like permease
LSALVFGTSDFLGGLTARRAPALQVVVGAEAVGVIVGLAVAPFFGGFSLTLVDVGWSIGAGVAGVAGFVVFFKGLAERRMSVVSPVSALTTGFIPVLVAVALGERPSLPGWIGVALALPAIWLVSAVKDERKGPAGVWHGLTAGLGFALFAVFISRTDPGSGLWPLVLVRLVSLILASLTAVAGRVPLVPAHGNRSAVLVVGLGDMVANVLFLLAVRSGMLSLVAVVAALYPAFTVLLASLILKERIHPWQRVGLVFAAGALVLIAST